MLIDEKPLQHWLHNFYGYGSWNARVWFVSYEEPGGDLPEEVAEKLNYFYKSHPGSGATLCDIRELYQEIAYRNDGPKAGLFKNLHEQRFGKKALLNSVWRNLISFVHGYQGKSCRISSTTRRKILRQSQRQ